MNHLCCIPILQRLQKAEIEYGAEKQAERCNAADEMLQDGNNEAVLQRQSDSDHPSKNANTTNIIKMPLKLLELPLVLVRDILNHVVQSYTTHQSLSLRALLSIKKTNCKYFWLQSDHRYADHQHYRFLQRRSY
jgi:hypothetical protein